MYVFPQYIGVLKMSSQYPECSGKESSLSTCLVQHRDTSIKCSAKRVVVVCFPTTMDPQTDLPLCGFEVPSLPTTAQTDNSSTRFNHDSITTLAESLLTEDVTVSFLITGGSYSGFSKQKSDSILTAFCLGVTFAAMLLHVCSVSCW